MAEPHGIHSHYGSCKSTTSMKMPFYCNTSAEPTRTSLVESAENSEWRAEVGTVAPYHRPGGERAQIQLWTKLHQPSVLIRKLQANRQRLFGQRWRKNEKISSKYPLNKGKLTSDQTNLHLARWGAWQNKGWQSRCLLINLFFLSDFFSSSLHLCVSQR